MPLAMVEDWHSISDSYFYSRIRGLCAAVITSKIINLPYFIIFSIIFSLILYLKTTKHIQYP